MQDALCGARCTVIYCGHFSHASPHVYYDCVACHLCRCESIPIDCLPWNNAHRFRADDRQSTRIKLMYWILTIKMICYSCNRWLSKPRNSNGIPNRRMSAKDQSTFIKRLSLIWQTTYFCRLIDTIHRREQRAEPLCVKTHAWTTMKRQWWRRQRRRQWRPWWW